MLTILLNVLYNICAGRDTLYTCGSEFAFKRYVKSAAHEGRRKAVFLFQGVVLMDLYVYSDESGVFDYIHNDIFVFGGLIFLSKDEKDNGSRLFRNAEKSLCSDGKHTNSEELKACKITPKEKSKLFRSLNKFIKFGVVIKQKDILKQIYDNKKSKQRYLDYAYKIALKRALESLISDGIINPEEVINVNVFVDEHTTATDGKYELREALIQEFKLGTFNFTYRKFFPPIFPNLKDVKLSFCDSSKKVLIRAADIVANSIYYGAKNNDDTILKKQNMLVIYLPY